MNALVVASLAFFAACLSVVVARSDAARARALLVWLGPFLAAAAAGGLYAWYETRAASPVAPSIATPGPVSGAMAPGRSGDLNEIGRQLAKKLGEDAPPAAQTQKHDAGDLRELSKRLAEKLERDPENGPGWALLARSYANIQSFDDAERAFARAAKLQPRDAAVLAEWAEAYLMAHGRNWDKRAAELVKEALAIDPKQMKALALAGAEAHARNDDKAAAGFWKRLKAAAPPDSAEAREAGASLAQIKVPSGSRRP